MRSPLVLFSLLALFGLLDVVFVSSEVIGAPAPRAASRVMRPRKRGAAGSTYVNPLLAMRQMKANDLRAPRKAKRACPSFLPNGNCACPAGTTYCGGDCVNLNTDPSNCGGCGTKCLTGGSCHSGSCACPSGEINCYGTCTNIDSNASNCGACRVSCGTYEVCEGAECVCEPGVYTECGGACIFDEDFNFDSANCGYCGNACPTGGYCEYGTCECDDGTTLCEGACVTTGECQILGHVAVSYSSAPSTIVCYTAGDGCSSTSSGGDTWVGSPGVPLQNLQAGGSGVFTDYYFFPFSQSADVGPGTYNTGDIGPREVPTTGPGDTPAYSDYIGEYYETDVWSISGTPVQTTGGTGYEITMIWVSPDGTTQPMTFYDNLNAPDTAYGAGSVEFAATGGAYLQYNPKTFLTLYFIPATGS